tara:strand:- start:971 stop:1240 length:270 start_codon:yes stop_codon:yes gene_type:complete
MLEVTEKTLEQKKEAERKLANHYNAGNCEAMKELDEAVKDNNFAEFKEVEGNIFALENIIENTSKSCSKKHNGNIAIYKLVTGALGYDS